MSGIQVTDNVKDIISRMKVKRCDDDVNKRLRIITFTIQNDIIDVDKCFCQEEFETEDPFQKLTKLMTDDTCFYALYDCHFETKEGSKKEELIFVTWIPDGIKIKLRMSYASSKNAIKNLMKGVKHDFQVNDRADFCSRLILADCLEKSAPPVKMIEGKCLSD
ncbi:cofilin-1-like [Xyrichtys novacula]|uniref:Cofilin-1-like n=1 Tax=Xyrichtys novacula TaxID=13765 RepID=A0AAV1G3J0_XYRNO|nr:cofilin-1-like [Xyrichtys novacula]